MKMLFNIFTPFLVLLMCATLCVEAEVTNPKYSGDVYLVTDNEQDESADSTSSLEMNANINVDFEGITQMCNSSFRMPPSYVMQFDTTGSLPDEVDKTGMCYYRCYYEKSGLLENWKMNKTLVRKYLWPATGDSLEFCEQQGKNETNECVRAYAIVKCVTLRSLTDARNNPMV